MSRTIAVDENQVEFLQRFSLYGFKSQDDLVKEALNRLRLDFERTSLEESADLYAQIYAEDPEVRSLTQLALTETVDD
jgi:hypothetical protein